MGKKLVLTGVQFDAPILVAVDPIESDGSLFLYEPGHPANPLVGTPATGNAASNLFADQATALAGDPCHGAWTISDLTAGKGLIERSALGGVHYVTSRTLGSSGMVARVDIAAALKTYVRVTADTHHYYVSSWVRKTRLEVSSANSILHHLTSSSSPTSNYIVYQHEGGSAGGGGGGGLSNPARTTGNQRLAVHGTGWAGTKPSDNTTTIGRLFAMGNTILNGSALTVANWVIYRAYIEDLTVSGRSHTEVDALDTALYTEHVLTPGGRYYGDTYTDPATVT